MNHKLICILLFLLPFGVQAQLYRSDSKPEPGKPWQQIGVKAGAGFATISSDGFRDPRVQVGVQGGVYYRISLGGRFHFQPELSAAYKGAKFDRGTDTGFVYTRLGLFYMDMPLYLVASLDEKEKHNLMLGPNVSFLMRPNLYILNEYYPTFTELPLNRFSFGLVGGYLFSSKHIGVQVAFKYGLTSIAGDFANYNTPGNGGSNGTLYLKDLNPPLTNVKRLMNRSLEISLYF